MSFIGCLAIGLWYWVCQSDLSKVLIVPGDTYWMGLIIGLFFGNPAKGFMIAATIELAYMGVVGVGGTLPSDKKLAALIAIPLSLQLNLELGTALAIAIPFGMLGGIITNTGYALCSFTHEIMVRHVKEKKYGALYFDAYGYPLLVKLPLAVIPVTAILVRPRLLLLQDHSRRLHALLRRHRHLHCSSHREQHEPRRPQSHCKRVHFEGGLA